MKRWKLVVALLCPTLAWAFEVGDKLVCIRSCEVKDGEKTRSTLLPGDVLTVAAEKNGLVQDDDRGRGWAPANCLIAKDQAERHFLARLQRNGNDVEAHCGLALSLVDNDKKRALAEVREAVRRKENWITLERLSKVQRLCDEREEAVTSLNRAIEIEPERLQLYYRRGSLQTKSDPRSAVADLTYVLDRDPHCTSALEFRAAAWHELKDLERSLDDYDTAVKLEPTKVNYLVGRAVLLDAYRKPLRALADIEEALRIDPRHPQAYKMQGMILVKRHEIEPAIAAITKAIELDPEDANAWSARGMCLIEKGDFDKALEDLNEAIRRAPEIAEYRGHRGYIWHRKQDYDRAIADLTEAIRLEPKNGHWYDSRGAMWLKACEYGQALADLQKAVELDPGATRAKLRLAWIYTTAPDDTLRNLDKAAKIMTPVVKQLDKKQEEAKECFYMEVIAAMIAEGGNFKEAAKLQHFAVGMAKDDDEEKRARERLALYESGKVYRGPTKRR